MRPSPDMLLNIPVSDRGHIVSRLTFPSGRTYVIIRDGTGRVIDTWEEQIVGPFSTWPRSIGPYNYRIEFTAPPTHADEIPNAE